jgi:hypothetical protein
VQERRLPAEGVEVRRVGQDHMPVLDVEERGEGVAAGAGQIGREADRHDGHGDQDHHDQGRQQAPRAPQPEGAEVDATRRAALGEEQRRDQVPAQDEEDVDAEKAARYSRDAAVVEQYESDREGADAVETRPVGQGGGSIAGGA